MIDFPPPLPPPLVAQNNKVDQGITRTEQFQIDNSIASSPLRWLEVHLQPKRLELTHKIFPAINPGSKSNSILYSRNTEVLNWLKVSCSQCSNKLSRYNW